MASVTGITPHISIPNIIFLYLNSLNCPLNRFLSMRMNKYIYRYRISGTCLALLRVCWIKVDITTSSVAQ